MTTEEISNRTVKALAIASVLFENRIPFETARQVAVDQGPFWPKVVKATGRRNGKLSDEARGQALYFLAAMQIGSRKLRRVK